MLKRHLLILIPTLVCGSAFAQFRVEVSGVGLTQVPIAIATFRGDESAPQKIASIVQADLERSTGGTAETNDDTYDNGKKIVPAYLLPPVIVTKDNAAEAYANDPKLSPLTK